MSKFSLLAMAAITALTACSAAARTEAEPADAISAAPIMAEANAPEPVAPASAHAQPARHASHYDAVTCEVRSRRTANGLLIQARAFADRDISGEYDLVITKSGSAGSSDISQSGALDLTAGSSALLGENEISVERGARVRATLTLRDDSGRLCRRSVTL
ncbi:MAG: curli-like amyloid fiber formation chaperone CsgH [Terricaulis sp.]